MISVWCTPRDSGNHTRHIRRAVDSCPMSKTNRETEKSVMNMKPRIACDREHDFVLVLGGITEVIAEAENALFESGCDDCTISVRFGRVFLSFSRTAPSLKEAILSAIRDLKKADSGADVLRVDHCNLVSQADIGRKIGRSRQLVHQFINGTRGPGGFPSPACEITDGAPLWYWCEVAHWLWQNDMIKENAVRDAREVAAINTVLELQYHRQIEPALVEEIFRDLTGAIPAT